MKTRSKSVAHSSWILGALILVAVVARSSISSRGGTALGSPLNAASAAPRLQQLTAKNWSTFITNFAAHGFAWNTAGAGTSGLAPRGFDSESFAPSHVVFDHGQVDIRATYGSDRPGYTWTSGVVCSYGSATFDGGYLEVTAQLPTMTTGAWPAIWMLPGPTDPDRDEIDIFEGGLTDNNDDPNDNFAGTVRSDGGKVGGPVDVGVDLSRGTHTFAINWIPGKSITWYLDGAAVQTVTDSQIRIPTKPMVLVMDLQVADQRAAGWHTVSSRRNAYEMSILSVKYSPDWRVASALSG